MDPAIHPSIHRCVFGNQEAFWWWCCCSKVQETQVQRIFGKLINFARTSSRFKMNICQVSVLRCVLGSQETLQKLRKVFQALFLKL